MQTITITASHSRQSYREGKQYKSPGMAKFRSRIGGSGRVFSGFGI